MIDTKDKLIKSAKELFAQKGYAAVRTKEIAKHAGVNEATLFRNFSSKQELYNQVIVGNIKSVDSSNAFHKQLTGNLSEDLNNIASQIFMLYQANSQIIKAILKGVIQNDASSETFSAECRGSHIKKHLTDYLIDMKSKGKIKDDPLLVSELFMNCMHGYLLSAFILDEKRPQLDDLHRLADKIITCINI